MSSDRTEITECLRAFREGDHAAGDALSSVIYRELKKLAVSCMRGEQPGRTLHPTALVSEVFIRLLRGKKVDWQSRAHFFAFAAGTMRHIILDAARRRHAGRRGAGIQFIDCDNVAGQQYATSIEEVLAVDECLRRLNDIDNRQARFVELRFFGGLSIDEIAEVESVSAPTVKRELQSARAWLRRAMTHRGRGADNGARAVAAD